MGLAMGSRAASLCKGPLCLVVPRRPARRPRHTCTLHRLLPRQNVPVANAKPEDIQDLLGGALFKALYKWMEESGPVYLLPTGARAPRPTRGQSRRRAKRHGPLLTCWRDAARSPTRGSQGPCRCWAAPLPTHAGPVSSFLVISDPEAAKHVLRASGARHRDRGPNSPVWC